jgi:hypothetical protein
MTYIHYANNKSEAGKILYQTLQRAFKKSWMKRCRTFAELSKRLHEPLYDVCAAVLLINDRKELAEILSLKDILLDIKLIIIFSSQAAISSLEVMTLRPRFLTWTDADLSQVVEVLGSMMKREADWRRVTGISNDSNSVKNEGKGDRNNGTDSDGDRQRSRWDAGKTRG